jgi:hypothetical protein
MTNDYLEAESRKAADAVNNKPIDEAAATLSKELQSMSFSDQLMFLKLVQEKNNIHGPRNMLDLYGVNPDHNAHLWGLGQGTDYVITKPDQNLSKICMNDFENYQSGEKPTRKQLNKCVEDYARINKLENPDEIRAGQALIMPPLSHY